ncbi:hypothetical protein RclHR1_08030011 [Rhizophagus clarus]|nr:hypothetical protein RclHR1_08030011 [Rhizophagus clarus]
MWFTRIRKTELLKVHNMEMYNVVNTIHSDTSTARLESLTSSCRSSFSFRNSFNSMILNNMIRPTRPTTTNNTNNAQGSSSRAATTSENLFIDGQNQRSLAGFITIPITSVTSSRRNHQSRNLSRNDSSHLDSYLNENSQDILEIEPPPIYKP